MDSKLRTQIKRVMSDRARKIVKCSQNKASSLKPDSNSSLVSTSQTHGHDNLFPMPLQARINNKLNASSNTQNKITLQPIKTFELTSKESLISHIKQVYDETVRTNGSIIFAIQSISNSIMHFSKNTEKINIEDILNENLFLSQRDLLEKYKYDKSNDELRIEGQMQILLQIENLVNNQSKIDDDCVWEIANSIRWLNQIFKDKFKIEKFLFGEIYANYYHLASEFILDLMEELGYDKDDNNSGDTSIDKKNDDESLISNSSLNQSNSFEQSHTNDTNSQDYRDDDDILGDAKRKKLITRFPSSTLNTSRSIMVQSKKKLKLKVRSPYKSPSKIGAKWLVNTDHLRRSPRIKEKIAAKQTTKISITDTPLHKQNSTRIQSRQQKIIKRISFQPNKVASVVPDTPVKNDPRTTSTKASPMKSTR